MNPMSNTERSARPLARNVLALAMVAGTVFLPETNMAESVQFGAATNFPTASYPSVVVVADFNGDGIPDITVSTSEGLNMLLGAGGGAFELPTLFPFFGGALATGDFNGDCNMDLVGVYSYSTRITLGDGTGNLLLLTNMSGDFNFSTYPNAVAVGELNGDGKADIAIANSGNPTGRGVTVGFGKGDGFFGAPTNCALPETPGDIVLGDLDGGGRLDAVVSLLIYDGSNSNSVCVLTNRGDGTLAVSRYYDSSISDYHYSLKLADFNGDGRLDLAVLNYNAQSVTIWLNSGNGVFGSAHDYAVGFQPVSLAVGDFNGDRKVDLIVGGGPLARVLLGHGDGSFSVESPIPLSPAGTSPGTIAVGDFDGNGAPDLALPCLTNSCVAIKLNQTPPFLKITPMAGYTQIGWLATFGAGFGLECTTNPMAPENWQAFPYPPVLIGDQKAVADWTERDYKFYRLRKQ
jgi:hypothetical protein